jgi:hypothetical protein
MISTRSKSTVFQGFLKGQFNLTLTIQKESTDMGIATAADSMEILELNWLRWIGELWKDNFISLI